MTSARQAAANRRNAVASTGPKTPATEAGAVPAHVAAPSYHVWQERGRVAGGPNQLRTEGCPSSAM
jgi:hypothetical protein